MNSQPSLTSPLLTCYTETMKRVRCKSGLEGWRERLQRVYADFEEFSSYNELYSIAQRVGFRSAKRCWQANPLIEGSIEPSDLRRVV